MISLRPSLASYARIAYARELSGDRAGAAAAMRLALLSAAGQPEPTAWAHVELAKLELATGRSRIARRHVLAALASLPGYPSARVELARVEAADGNLHAAIREARRAVEATPTSQAVVLLGDLLARAGKTDEARRQRATVAVIDRLLEANGVRADLESASYRADNLIRPARDGRARATCSRRPAVDLRRRRPRLGARARGSVRRSAASRAACATSRDTGSAPLLPPWLRGGMCRESGGYARLVRTSARAESPVLGSLGASCASGSGPFIAGPGRIIGA